MKFTFLATKKTSTSSLSTAIAVVKQNICQTSVILKIYSAENVIATGILQRYAEVQYHHPVVLQLKAHNQPEPGKDQTSPVELRKNQTTQTHFLLFI